MRRELTQDRLKEFVDYDPVTGVFINKLTRGPLRRGERAGSPSGHGYRKISIDYCKHYEHHLAWLFVHGVYPGEMDHKDGNRSNNTIDNLRLATRADNCRNRPTTPGRSGITGAYVKNARTGSWFSKIQVGPRTYWLGTFRTAEEAGAAYQKAANFHYGQFSVHERPVGTQT